MKIRKMRSALLIVLATQSMATATYAADNKMGYTLQSADLKPGGGSLGMKVGPEREITSEGLTFEVLKVEGVSAASPAAQAGLKVGDQIIAVDGRVFPSVAVFASYVGSVAPGQQIDVDYMPAGGGPQQAQRVGVTVGERGAAATPRRDEQRGSGLSTGEKVAIGTGAVAIFGCYEAGCFSRLKKDIEAERERHQGLVPAPAVQR